MTIRILAFGFLLLIALRVEAGDQLVSPEIITIPAGPFIMGSKPNEREAAYQLDEAAYGHKRTREWKWYEGETQKQPTLPAFQITRTLITNRQYQSFITLTGYPAPDVSRKTWAEYGLIHPYQRTRRHAWKADAYPKSRAAHPVVLISHDDARAYADWLSAVTPWRWRLPTEEEWEKAARGTDGRQFPWGNGYDPSRLNSHDKGPFDTLPVNTFADGNSPFGLVDAAGQVFEWTSTPAGSATSTKARRYIVKGGSWDDSGCGICRPAARHSRPANLKHILIGFRLVRVNLP